MLNDAPVLLQAEPTVKSGLAVNTPKRRSSANRKKEVPHSFDVSEDYGTVRYRGKDHVLTSNQSLMMRVLHQAYLNRFPDVEKLKLLAAIENEESQVKDSWKRSPLWGTLIVSSKRRGRYRLNLPKPARVNQK